MVLGILAFERTLPLSEDLEVAPGLEPVVTCSSVFQCYTDKTNAHHPKGAETKDSSLLGCVALMGCQILLELKCLSCKMGVIKRPNSQVAVQIKWIKEFKVLRTGAGSSHFSHYSDKDVVLLSEFQCYKAYSESSCASPRGENL